MPENPLTLLMNPKSIAVVGANNDPMKMGTIQALSIVKDGYKGAFYPIHLTEKTVLGYRAYASARDLPEPPDLVVFIVPNKAITDLLEDFGKIGTSRAIIVTAGYKETGAAGLEMEKRIIETAERYGMRFVGPNCLGIINSEIHLNTTVAPFHPGPGLLGFASQSGTYVTQALSYLRKRGIRFSKAISLGNEANIDIVDALEYLGDDEQTKAIILYIEGIRDGRRFVDAARRITRKKPVVAQYVGGSVSGARAGLSHTGAMAGPDFLYDGILRQAGIIRVGSIEELYTHGWTLATQPPLAGNRVGVMTNSGGPATAISYTCDLVGLEVPRFSDALQRKIKKHIEPHASAANPVDLTFHLDMKKLALTLPEMMIKSGEVDAIVLHGAMQSGFMKEIHAHVVDLVGGIGVEDFLQMTPPVSKEAFELTRGYGIPMVVSSFFGAEDGYTKGYLEADTPVFHSPEHAARALGSLYRYKLIRERKPADWTVLPPPRETAVDSILRAQEAGRKALDEHEAKRVLAAYGVPVAREVLAVTESEALEAADSIGYPVALKACSWEIMHKSGAGLIALNIDSAERLRDAFLSIRNAAGNPVPVLVQEMLRGNREFLAGMTRFEGFGPCVVFGLGGVFTEIYRDTTLRVAPIADTDAEEMFEDIRARELLHDFRGMPPVDSDRLRDIVKAVGTVALLHPEIAEIDLNPIIISGADPVVADALIVLGDTPAFQVP
ncbi:MAG: acetate--CoA ligase family protein [Syntrophales bacterium]|jgi:acetyltransferase|nr:acetate--CoA ligase family protein [Syntrophales bacterium]MCK9528657.1 acetate--CoA ligase family protein [Syntrophales bacterium]MDX9922036.1 acetate--CoA ligase family protein [Syntrophales bacterium]